MSLSLLCRTPLYWLQAQQLSAHALQAEALSLDLGAPQPVRKLAASLARLASLGSSAAEVQALKVCFIIGLSPKHELVAHANSRYHQLGRVMFMNIAADALMRLMHDLPDSVQWDAP